MRVVFTFFSCLSGTVFLLVLLSSCGDTRHLTYMQGKFDTAALSEVKLTDPVIQKGDMLSIIVYSDNPQATAIYNQSLISGSGSSSGSSASGNSSQGGSSGSPSGNAPSAPGYLVDEQGNIEFQGLGTLHVVGLTRALLKDTLSGRLKEYLQSPYFNIRFLNYRISMLGELVRPGVYSMPGEHLNILEAVGLAGDMTVYGRRDNVLVIREVNGKREFGRLDFTKPDIMASPYFNLQQNDIVYVDQIKAKSASVDLTARNLTIAATVVTTLAVVLSLLRK